MTRADDVWTQLAKYGLWIVAALILIQTLPTLGARWLWFSDEVRYADVLSNLIHDGKWIVLELNGRPYPDKPPVYFLFLAALNGIFHLDIPHTLMLGSALTAILLAGALNFFARTIGLSREEGFAGLLVWMTGIGVLFLLRYVRMDLAFVSFMFFGHAYLHRYAFQDRPGRDAVIGWAFFGLATLTKGPLGIAIPLVALLLSALWAGRMKRVFTGSMALGVLVCALVCSTWVLGIVLVQGWNFFAEQIIDRQVVERAVATFHHSEGVSYYFKLLPILMLPWTGLIFSLPVMRAAPAARKIAARRHEARPTDVLVASALAGFALLSSLDGKVAVYLLPIGSYLSLACGVWLLSLPMRLGRWAVSLVIGALAVGLLTAKLGVEGVPFALWLGAGFLVLASVALAVLRHRGLRLIGVALAFTGFGLTAGLGILPLLNDSLSTRLHAEVIATAAKDGATPVAYKTYPGIFNYYAGRTMVQIDDAKKLAEFLAATPDVVLVADEKALKNIDMTGFKEVYRHVIDGAGGTFVVMRRTGG